MLRLLQYLNSIYPLNPEIEQYLIKSLRQKIISKNKVWLKKGEVCSKIAFIETGLLKISTEIGTREMCVWFNKESDIVISVKSFFKREPSEFFIEAIEPTELYYIDYNDLQYLYSHFPVFNLHGRILLEHYYVLSEEYSYLMHMPPVDRYRRFLTLMPWLKNRILEKEIASYLGMSRAALCNVKNETI